jgi:ABC-type Fe3+/spermidine/putrescine transport system ATPase subunit
MTGPGTNGAGAGPIGSGASVTLSNLEKAYDRASAAAKAVDGVSLDIRSGEFLTMLGPSGSGKTTTLMMIAGFETPTAGDIAIDGRSVVAMPPYRRNIGMVFQNYALFPHLTVEENVGFPLKQRGIPKAERAKLVADALELVHLPGYGARYPRRSPAASSSAWRVARALSCSSLGCCCSTSRWARSTSKLRKEHADRDASGCMPISASPSST